MEQQFSERQSLVADLSQQDESCVPDSNAAVNHNTLLNRWQTVDAQIQVCLR